MKLHWQEERRPAGHSKRGPAFGRPALLSVLLLAGCSRQAAPPAAHTANTDTPAPAAQEGDTPPARLPRRVMRPAAAGPFHVVLEAETGTGLKAPMQVGAAVDAGGGKALHIPLQPKHLPQQGGECTGSLRVRRNGEARDW